MESIDSFAIFAARLGATELPAVRNLFANTRAHPSKSHVSSSTQARTLPNAMVMMCVSE